ncbi:nucleotide-diphospho-sugar transferase [Fibrella aquatilis]|uniref:Nucleotide-diphospho-sugar transferase n=1 Tax=Fibrella aquatilis TaxID=2817059 RepID=A0A939JVK4_9BACT|nr:nucleotide-diphospho-sugar transferase [Fibrella aquatilis]MBO0930952.1 nucleotide-diphospho-sugar transferase [Fibrella aquatilis]
MTTSHIIDTPILLIWFNRPQHSSRVLERLRELKPATLFVAIDGPREGRVTDIKQVSDTILLLDTIDWPCTIQKLIRTENLGCKCGVSSAIDWFFEQVDMGIILEDDCLPDPSFFSFCADLLERYHDNEQVMHIGGANLASGKWWSQDSYLFTKVCHIWGWATWQRAWQHYDVAMATYPSRRDRLIDQLVDNKASRKLWKQVFDDTYAGRVDTWDYQWVYSIWAAGGLSILPSVNLISNIGFDSQATHTHFATEFANLPTGSLPILHHPNHLAEHKEATQWLFGHLYQPLSTWVIWLEKVKRRVPLLKKRR